MFQCACCHYCRLRNSMRCNSSIYRREDGPYTTKKLTRESKKSFTNDEALWIANYLNIKFNKFDLQQFRIGLNVELEHGTVNPFTNITNDDFILTGKITLAHLNEYPDYYKRLTKMEEEAEKYWEKE